MDYGLRRQPDGTVNAQPGDAVEYWMYGRWNANRIEGQAYGEFVILGISDEEPRIHTHISNVRHARGGAGWHRLREARLHELVKALADERDNLAQGHIKPYSGLISTAIDLLAELDQDESGNK